MKSKLLVMVTTVLPLSLALVTGFSGTPKTYADAAESVEAKKSESNASAAKPTSKKDLSRYTKVVLPAELDSGEDAEFTGTATVTAKFTDSETGKTVASFMTKETAKGSFPDALPKAIDKVVQTVGAHLEQDK